jgi:hypothetical protein
MRWVPSVRLTEGKPRKGVAMWEPDSKGPSQAERTAAIREALINAGDVTHFVPAEAGYLEANVIELDHTCLVYRADNGRILSELASAARLRETTFDELKAVAEGPEVQLLLHNLLVEKSRDQRGPIYAELARFGRQTEPLLISSDGVVLNGNRRLAAMRDLLAKESTSFGQFACVRAAVLPGELSDNEIEFVEAALQMAPDLKLDYGWINRRLKLRQHVDDMGVERVVAAYRLSDSEAIDRELGELALAEEYLEWIGHPQEYPLIDNQEDAFVALLRTKLQMAEKWHLYDIWQRIGFAMIKVRADLDRDIMHYFPLADPTPWQIKIWVPRSLAEDHGIVERQATGENQSLDAAAAHRLVPLLNEPRQARNTALAAMALIDTLKGGQKRLIGYADVVACLRKATQTLNQMRVEDLSDDQTRQLRAKLAALREYLAPPD